ncbi:MAG: 16S rRNA (guanine(527)-N(7))-methyltransferase RsmG [Woeseiaceae bacterium]
MQDRVEQIAKAVETVAPDRPAGSDEKFARLLDELEQWNKKVNLTAIRDPDEMITGHLLDSLVARPLLQGSRILDMGTGAGFPGLPLAICEPERQFELVDGNNKKIKFVQHAVTTLQLSNVTATWTRTEDFAPEQRFDTVIARAVGPLARLVKMAGHHVGEDGVFVAMKGRYPDAELKKLPKSWMYDIVELEVPGLDKGSRHAVLLKRR